MFPFLSRARSALTLQIVELHDPPSASDTRGSPAITVAIAGTILVQADQRASGASRPLLSPAHLDHRPDEWRAGDDQPAPGHADERPVAWTTEPDGHWYLYADDVRLLTVVPRGGHRKIA